ncbi:hypothetical protein ACFX15_036486 [Malus domestica]
MSYPRKSRYSYSPSPKRYSGSLSRSVSRSRYMSRSPSVQNRGNNLYVTGWSPRVRNSKPRTETRKPPTKLTSVSCASLSLPSTDLSPIAPSKAITTNIHIGRRASPRLAL